MGAYFKFLLDKEGFKREGGLYRERGLNTACTVLKITTYKAVPIDGNTFIKLKKEPGQCSNRPS